MGTDIHLCVEVKNNEKWEVVKKMPTDSSFYKILYEEEKEKGETGHWTKRWEELKQEGGSLHWLYSNRNYDLFAILANVRNGMGVAGCDTGDGFIPIAFPRGTPVDVSTEINEAINGWGCDGHSHSYLTLRELLEYNWNRKTKHRGWVGTEVYKQFKKNGNPYPCSGGVWGRNIVHVSNEEMDELIKNDTFDENLSYYTQIEWEETYKECCKFFLEKCIPELKKLASSPDDVRIVFWFDN